MAMEERNLVKYYIVPTLETMEFAKERGVTPEEYIEDQPIYLDGNNGDGRRRGQCGYLEDVAIYLPDGTRMQIHPILSDVKEMQKIEIYLYEKDKKYGQLIKAYTDGLDFIRMQHDQDYLQVLGKQLLDKKRLEDKKRIANENGLEEEIYIGTIRTNRYGRYAKFAKEGAIEIIKSHKEKARYDEIEKENKKAKWRKDITEYIKNNLDGLSDKELEEIARQVEQSLYNKKLYEGNR